jgi:hypothetical protein
MDPNNNGKDGKLEVKAPVLNPEDVTMEVRIALTKDDSRGGNCHTDIQGVGFLIAFWGKLMRHLKS